MATAEGAEIIDDDGLFECDKCGAMDTPEAFAYIGPKDDTTECSPFMVLEGNWQQTCWTCAGGKTA